MLWRIEKLYKEIKERIKYLKIKQKHEKENFLNWYYIGKIQILEDIEKELKDIIKNS